MIFRKFELFLAQKLFISFSERGMISIPLDTSGTKAQGRVNALRSRLDPIDYAVNSDQRAD